MHDRLPGLILGYHGCDRGIGEAGLPGKAELKVSENAYDWLGHGIYFWEHNPTLQLNGRVSSKKGHGMAAPK